MVSKKMFSVTRPLLSWGSYWGILYESREPTCGKKGAMCFNASQILY